MTTIGASIYPTSTARYDALKPQEKLEDSSTSGARTVIPSALPTGTDQPAHLSPSSKLQGQLTTLTTQQLEAIRIKLEELPEDQYQEWIEAARGLIEANEFNLKNEYTEIIHPDLRAEPRNDPYATVVKNGRVIATLYNDGSSGYGDDGLAKSLKDLIADFWNGRAANDNGPSSAQELAEEIARRTGGKIVLASTALTQAEFKGLPELQQTIFRTDVEAMKNDPAYARIEALRANLQKMEQDRAAFLAKQ